MVTGVEHLMALVARHVEVGLSLLKLLELAVPLLLWSLHHGSLRPIKAGVEGLVVRVLVHLALLVLDSVIKVVARELSRLLGHPNLLLVLGVEGLFSLRWIGLVVLQII